MQGIYQYIDKKTNEIVYIGKDSYIDEKRRYKAHIASYNYNKQPFNRVLQNNPDKYKYEEIYVGDFSQDLLNVLEINSIAEFKLQNNGNRPKFNFTDGGDGVGFGENHPNYGKKLSEETKKKISKANSGKNHPMYGKHHSEESKKKMSENRWDNFGENNPMYGKHHSEETKKKISKAQSGKKQSKMTKKKRSISTNTSGYLNVYKHKSKRYKQGFIWKYQYYKNGKRKSISSVDIKKLEEKVKKKRLEWMKFDQ